MRVFSWGDWQQRLALDGLLVHAPILLDYHKVVPNTPMIRLQWLKPEANI